MLIEVHCFKTKKSEKSILCTRKNLFSLFPSFTFSFLSLWCLIYALPPSAEVFRATALNSKTFTHSAISLTCVRQKKNKPKDKKVGDFPNWGLGTWVERFFCLEPFLLRNKWNSWETWVRKKEATDVTRFSQEKKELKTFPISSILLFSFFHTGSWSKQSFEGTRVCVWANIRIAKQIRGNQGTFVRVRIRIDCFFSFENESFLLSPPKKTRGFQSSKKSNLFDDCFPRCQHSNPSHPLPKIPTFLLSN